MKRLGFLAMVIVAIAALPACRAPVSDSSGADAAAIRKSDEDWSLAAAGLKDLDKTVAFYADDALVMPPNGLATTSKTEIRAIWKGYLDSEDFAGGWKVGRIEVAKSGDIGYASGTWEFTWKENGKPATDRGNFTEIWKKQADGSWKCVADIWNSDQPLPSPTAK